MQVLSHDETSILVEAGGFTPMRWFLERGAHHMQAAEDDIESEQPPNKRTKLSRSSKPRAKSVITSATTTIPLARVTVDIHFPETLAAKLPKPETIDRDVDFEESNGIPVILYGITDDDLGVQIQLAHPPCNVRMRVLEERADGLASALEIRWSRPAVADVPTSDPEPTHEMLINVVDVINSSQ